jgi:RNA ligase
MASSLPTETPDVSMKLDGSLGILYKHKETYRIATRGSFTSEQAVKATEILRNKYAAVDFSKYPQHTFLFEIIYPENRIVVNYNDTEDLFLIGLVDTLSGYELPYPEVIKIADELGLKSVTVEQKDLDSILNDIDGAKGIEGFVLHFPLAQLRCKIKTDEYRTLHKTLSKLNRHFIWENLAKNIDISVLAGAIPDECYGWMKDQKSIFEGQFIEVDTKLERIFESIPKDLRTRKEFANYAKTVASGKELSILFKMYDKKPYDEIIWQILEPVGKIEAPRSMARRGSCDQN